MLPTILEIKALYINYRVMYKVHHSVLPKGVILYLILFPNQLCCIFILSPKS